MAELTIQELGESLVQALTGVQRSLAGSATEAGRYLMNEVELDVPVRLRVGPDGQVLVTPAESDDPPHQLTRIRLTVRPAEADEAIGLPLPAGTDRPLSVIPNLAEVVIQRLNSLHLYTIGDFLRVTSTVRGYRMMAQLGLDFDLDKTIEQAKLVASPEMPHVLAEDLLRHGVNSRVDFARLKREQLPQVISDRLLEIIGLDEIIRIQEAIRAQPDVIFGSATPDGRKPDGGRRKERGK
ncbi:MAG: hypothetical protein HZC41_19165 [Chloroflexi bacterium]|nr:hypothetical protein [Chloroflexota bacterium]